MQVLQDIGPSRRWFASHVSIFQVLPVLKCGSVRASGEPGSLAQTDAAAGQATLSNGWLVMGGIFLCEKLIFIPVE